MSQENMTIRNGIETFTCNDGSYNVGVLNICTANQSIERVKDAPDLRPLYDVLWYEEEICCLFATTNLGKSIFAIQIANEIAKTQNVLYVDCEMSDRQFRKRYSSHETSFRFENRLIRAKIDIVESSNNNSAEDELIENIHQAAVASESKVIIIDNLSWLCLSSERSGDATKLMRNLIMLRNQNKYSIMVIAHTPKLEPGQISENDLAGSKTLMNMMDSAFSIGRDPKDKKKGRYIKQVKSRMDEYKYSEDGVLFCTITKDEATGFLYYAKGDIKPEPYGRKNRYDSEDTEELRNKARVLYAEGKSIREIETTLKIRHGTFKKADLESPSPSISNEDRDYDNGEPILEDE